MRLHSIGELMRKPSIINIRIELAQWPFEILQMFPFPDSGAKGKKKDSIKDCKGLLRVKIPSVKFAV